MPRIVSAPIHVLPGQAQLWHCAPARTGEGQASRQMSPISPKQELDEMA